MKLCSKFLLLLQGLFLHIIRCFTVILLVFIPVSYLLYIMGPLNFSILSIRCVNYLYLQQQNSANFKHYPLIWSCNYAMHIVKAWSLFQSLICCTNCGSSFRLVSGNRSCNNVATTQHVPKIMPGPHSMYVAWK
jgi:hypothetical protein